MTRPHICFIQSQCLDWQPDALAGRSGAQVKVLSKDPADGASTLLVRYPPGWSLSDHRVLGSDEEFLVLTGALTLNGTRFDRHGYGHLPAGFERSELTTSEVTVVLTMFSAERIGRPPIDSALGTLVPDCYQLPWAGGREGSVTGKPLNSGLTTKIFYRHPNNGEQSFLYCSLPHHGAPASMPGKFTHPMVEEIFVLEGSFVFGDTGVMGPGGYCWWREGRFHGPVGSETGYLLFIRNLGGPLKNEFCKEPAPFSFNPSYQPVIPDELKAKAKPYQPAPKW